MQTDENIGRKLRLAVLCWEEQNGQRQGRGNELITHVVSPTGFSFYSKQIYPTGTVLVADVYLPGFDVPAACKLLISRVEALSDRDEYQIEAAFHELRPDDQAAIESLLDKLNLYQLLDKVLKFGATDLHLTVGRPPMMRKDGKIRPLTDELLQDDEVPAMFYPLLTAQQIANFEEGRELDFAISPTTDSRFRVNMHWQRGFAEAALRTIPTKIKSFSELGLPAESMREFCKHQAGLILIAGTTGSGKTTTLSSMVNYLNTTEELIVITVEDPIEYIHTSQKCVIKQREMGTDTLSYANGLRRVLRQDPDVICVGELLDGEALAAALRAAETGHLVISTIHAPDTAQAIQRIVNFFPPEAAAGICQQLSTCLIGILFQALLPSPSRGRVPATELLLNNSAVANMIREARFSQISTVLQTGRREGMYTLKSSLQDLHERGLIETEVLESFKKLDYSQ